MKPKSTLRAFLLGYALLATSTAFAVDGTWNGISGAWSDTTDPAGVWVGGTPADGTDFTANFTGVNIIADQTINLTDIGRTIGNITFTDLTTSSHNLIISGANTLTLDRTDATKPTINVTQTGRAITISSQISGADGLQKNGVGNLVLGSALNDYSGGTTINAGLVQISSDGNLGNTTGDITFGLGYSQLLTGTAGLTLNAGRTITLSSGATAAIGQSNQNGAFNFTINGQITGSGDLQVGRYQLGTGTTFLANTTNDFTGRLIIGSFSTFTAPNWTIGGFTADVASLADTASLGSGNIIFGTTRGAAGDSGSFQWSANALTGLILNNRRIQIADTTGANTIAGVANNASAANTVVINTNLLVTATSAKTLQLGGVNLGNNEFNGIIANGAGSAVINLTKTGGGKWILSNAANAYTGITTVSAGTLEISKLDIGGNNSSIGASTAVATNLVFNNGGSLRYTGSGDTTDRAFTYNSTTNNSGWSIDSSGSTGALSFTNTAAITFTGSTNQTRTLTLTGSNTGDNLMAAAITNSNGTTTNQVSVAKTGLGKWVLTGTNSYTGSTFANFGTLELRNAGIGLTQTLGALNSNQSEGTLISNNAGTGTLSTTFASAGRTNGGTANIIIQGGTNGVDNLINITGAQGFINKGLYFNGSEFAARNALDGYVRALDYGTDPSAAAVDTITASNHVKLTSTPASQALITLLSLNLAGSGVSWTSSDTLTVPGIIKSGGGSQSTITGSNLTAGANTELVIRTNTVADSLAISSNLTQGTGGLTKSGSGTLTLSGTNTYTGQTRIQSGTLVMGASNVFAVTPVVIDNATLDAGTFTDTVGTLDVNTSGATINLGAGAALAFAASNGVSWTDSTSGRLNITGAGLNFSGGVGSSLRFGTTSAGLTATQLGLISATGFTNFALDASGYLTATATGGNTYATWIGGFPGAAAAPGFTQDADNDGIPNGAENFFGTNPSTFSSGLVASGATGGTFTFTHPQSATPASDISAAYLWSKDLTTFNAGGATEGGSTVTFSTQLNTPTTGITTVTATVTGTPLSKLFVRVNVIKN